MVFGVDRVLIATRCRGEHRTRFSRCSKRPVLLAFFLLGLSCASKPLLLLLLEPRSRYGILDAAALAAHWRARRCRCAERVVGGG
jgi:hypothetical protein